MAQIRPFVKLLMEISPASTIDIMAVAKNGMPKVLQTTAAPMSIVQNNIAPIVSPLEFSSKALPHERQNFALSSFFVLQFLQIFIFKLL